MSAAPDLGDRMKIYERSDRTMPLLPVCIRLDGKNFSRWSKGYEKPFDPFIMAAMDAANKALVAETNALVGYTQSDELTLILHSSDYRSQVYFDGKVQKICSVLASLMTVHFNSSIISALPGDGPVQAATFDCRVWQVPNLTEASNVILWREQDAIKNSIQALGQANFSHRQLQGKGQLDIVAMLSEKGVEWDALADREKRGGYVRRGKVFKELDPETLAKIPEGKRPKGPIERSEIAARDMPPLSSMSLEDRLVSLFGAPEAE